MSVSAPWNASFINLVRPTIIANFILSVHLCVQHDGRDAVRRAGWLVYGSSVSTSLYNAFKSFASGCSYLGL